MCTHEWCIPHSAGHLSAEITAIWPTPTPTTSFSPVPRNAVHWRHRCETTAVQESLVTKGCSFPEDGSIWIWAIHKHGGMWTKGDLILRRKGPNVFRLGVWTDENVSDMISTAIKETKERSFLPQRCAKWILWNKQPVHISSIHPRSFIRKHKVDLNSNLERKISGIVWCKWRHLVVGGECLIKF